MKEHANFREKTEPIATNLAYTVMQNWLFAKFFVKVDFLVKALSV